MAVSGLTGQAQPRRSIGLHATRSATDNRVGRVMSKTVFEVYTRFGRVISRHVCDHTTELHHRAAEEARMSCARYPGDAWVRMVSRP